MAEVAFPRTDYLGEKIKRLMLARLVVVVLALLATATALRDTSMGALLWPLSPTYSIIVLAAGFNFFYLLLFRWVRSLETFAIFQIAVDIFTIGALVLFTGGVDSVFSVLFLVSVVSAGWILTMRATLALAGLAAALIAVIAAGYYMMRAGVLTAAAPYLGEAVDRAASHDLSALVTIVCAQGLEILLVALLFSKLVQRLGGARILNKEILENMTDGVVAIDRDQRLVYVNRVARGMLGIGGSDDIVGQSVDDVINADRHAPLRRALKGSRSRTMELVIASDTGKLVVPVEVGVSRLVDSKGKDRGAVALLADLTERRAMEEAMRRMARLEVVGEMSTSIAHEVRNPLASISGSAQMLLEMCDVDEEGRRLLELIIDESRRLDRLVTNFMFFSRPHHIDPSRCQLWEVVDDVTLMLSKAPDRPECSVDVIVPKDLVCYADSNLLKQVFYNLAMNAFQAMNNNGRLKIEAKSARGFPEGRLNFCGTGARGEAEGIVISFTDNGPGISGDVARRLFDPFFTTKTRGTGIGLAIVERIIESHKGQISLESREAKGATFRIWLPANRV